MAFFVFSSNLINKIVFIGLGLPTLDKFPMTNAPPIMTNGNNPQQTIEQLLLINNQNINQLGSFPSHF